MFENKTKITININEELYNRINDLVEYRNLWSKFELLDNDVHTIEDFIVGSTIERLKSIEAFTRPKQNKKLLINDDKSLKNNIKKYLDDHGIKQIELTNVLKIDKSALSMYLNNYKQPPIDLFIKIWAILDYPPIEELLYREVDD